MEKKREDRAKRAVDFDIDFRSAAELFYFCKIAAILRGRGHCRVPQELTPRHLHRFMAIIKNGRFPGREESFFHFIPYFVEAYFALPRPCFKFELVWHDKRNNIQILVFSGIKFLLVACTFSEDEKDGAVLS